MVVAREREGRRAKEREREREKDESCSKLCNNVEFMFVFL